MFVLGNFSYLKSIVWFPVKYKVTETGPETERGLFLFRIKAAELFSGTLLSLLDLFGRKK